MKKSISTKGLFTVVVFFVCTMMMSASMPRKYKYDTKEVNGKLVEKTIFTQDNGLLHKEILYKFDYNKVGQVSTKFTYRWNVVNEEWDPFYRVSYLYKDNIIVSSYGMWNKDKKDYSLNVKTLDLPKVDYKTIFE